MDSKVVLSMHFHATDQNKQVVFLSSQVPKLFVYSPAQLASQQLPLALLKLEMLSGTLGS